MGRARPNAPPSLAFSPYTYIVHQLLLAQNVDENGKERKNGIRCVWDFAVGDNGGGGGGLCDYILVQDQVAKGNLR